MKWVLWIFGGAAALLAGMLLLGALLPQPKPLSSEAVQASCDQQFGADTEGSLRCQTDILLKEVGRSLSDQEADRAYRVREAERNAR